MYEMERLSDEELVKEIIKKDQELYAVLVKRYEDKLFKYAFYLIRDKNKAMDVLQESFIKAFINLNSFNSKKKFSSWIYRIVHNESINTIKKHKKEFNIPKDFDLASNENIEEEFNKKELIEMTKKCLDQLPVKYREPLVLSFIEDKSYDEISDILRLPMGTVATRISRAKVQMKIICQKK